jgi:hypothetical protein
MAGQGLGVAVLGPIIDHLGYATAFCVTAIAIVLLGTWFQAKLAPTDAALLEVPD